MILAYPVHKPSVVRSSAQWGERLAPQKALSFFSLSLSFLMGSKMEDRMLSKSGKQMILCFLQIWHLANFMGEISFFPLPVFEVGMLLTGT